MRKPIDHRVEVRQMLKEHLKRLDANIGLSDQVQVKETHIENALGEKRPALQVESHGDPKVRTIIVPRSNGACDVRTQEQDPETGTWSAPSKFQLMSKQAVKGLLHSRFANKQNIFTAAFNPSESEINAAKQGLASHQSRKTLKHNRSDEARNNLLVAYKKQKLTQLQSHFAQALGLQALGLKGRRGQPKIELVTKLNPEKEDGVCLRIQLGKEAEKALMITPLKSGGFNVTQQSHNRGAWVSFQEACQAKDKAELINIFAQHGVVYREGILKNLEPAQELPKNVVEFRPKTTEESPQSQPQSQSLAL